MKTLLALLLTSSAFAQISEIATDATGQTLLLNTRFRMQTESDATREQKIYRWQNGVWTRLKVYTPTPGIIPGSIYDPFVAADGRIYGWMESPTRPLFSFGDPARVEAHGLGNTTLFPYTYIRASANGRYLASIGVRDAGLVLAQIENVQNGAVGRLQLHAELLQVGSDGSFAFWAPGSDQLVFRKLGAEERQVAAPGVTAMTMSDDARWIAVDAPVAGSRRLRVLSTATEEFIDLVPAGVTRRGQLNWRLGNSHLIFLSEGDTRLSSWDPVTRQTAMLTEFSEPVVDLALSADGWVAWAVTETNRLWRVDLRAGTREEILPPLGHVDIATSVPIVPGSAALLAGKFTAEQEVFAGTERWPTSDVNADGLWFQVPWEARGAQRELTVRAQGNPFEEVLRIGFDGEYQPYFPTQRLRNSSISEVLIAAHQDFRGVVSTADPARRGETIHVYMTGLGALAREVPTGERGPFPPVGVAKALTCVGQPRAGERGAPVQLAAVIYASGMIGFYQVDVTLPSDMPAGFWGLRCGDGVREAMGFFATGP